MEREVATAVAWWVEAVRSQGRYRSGDVPHDALQRAWVGRVTGSEAQLATFARALTTLLTGHLRAGPQGWDAAIAKGVPYWGAATRTLSMDYGPCALLREALEAAGISRLALPVKTVMWVNPGGVRVGCGYKQPVIDLPLLPCIRPPQPDGA